MRKRNMSMGLKVIPLSHCVNIPMQNNVVVLFNDMSTLMGHFVSSPREREERERCKSRVEDR